MTERARKDCQRNAGQFVIGPSALTWNDDHLEIRIQERSAPLPFPVRGIVRIYPDQLFKFSTPLDSPGKHRWGPIAPKARIEVLLDEPGQKWNGVAYLDSNEGDEPIDRAFRYWDWSRSQLSDGGTAVLYDLKYPDNSEKLLALRFDPNGGVDTFDPPLRRKLPKTAWHMQRSMHSSSEVHIEDQLEDTPFYQRSILKATLLGEPVTSFHETLSVPRLVSPIVRAMLPWRMPRRF